VAEKTARVVRIETVAPDMLLVACRMVAPPALPFRAGQFLSLRLGDDGKVRRSYSLASSPARQDGFDLLVRAIHNALENLLYDFIHKVFLFSLPTPVVE